MGRQRQICFLKLEKDDFFLKSRCPRYTELKFYEFLTYLESTSAEQLVLQGHYRTYPDCSQLSWWAAKQQPGHSQLSGAGEQA